MGGYLLSRVGAGPDAADVPLLSPDCDGHMLAKDDEERVGACRFRGCSVPCRHLVFANCWPRGAWVYKIPGSPCYDTLIFVLEAMQFRAIQSVVAV